MSGAIHLGVVTELDERRGLGAVADDAGSTWPFHCTAITDGSRAVDVGARVAFCVVAGHLGRMEAAQVTKLGRV
ncbi:MAG: cold shock domain-containing protein [Acidimicrobiales bacterium]